MKKLNLLLTLLFVATFSASGEERRLLTMEDAILNAKLTPENYVVSFDSENPKIYKHTDRKLRRVESFDIRSGRLISTDTLVAEAPKARHSYAVNRNNNLAWIDDEGNEVAITTFDNPAIVCGQSISRNEFGISGGTFPSPDNKFVAFYQKDESRVSKFPLLDITTRTGTLREIRYPMNGMASELVAVGVYDVAAQRCNYLKVCDFDAERYITNLAWSPDSKTIYVQVIDRQQKHVRLNAYDALSGDFVKTLLTEENECWVEPQHPITFIDNDRFIYTTNNRDGYRNLYLYTLSTAQLERLTVTDADVEYFAHSADKVYYYSAEVSRVERHLFVIDLRTRRTKQLTREAGWHTCRISEDRRYVADNFSSLNVPRKVALLSTDGKMYREIFAAKDPSAEYNYAPIELGTVKSADGKYDNYYRLIKPLDFDATKRYPVILYVYGGPHSQMVRNQFQAQLRRWEMYIAQRGYVVFVMDNRGTSNRGAAYEKAIHRQCGVCEMEDQMAGLRWLMSHDWVDSSRIGVHGWSYGGFMTISLMVNYPDIFKVGVAGGPVIDWKWYEVMYGERYMETEATNAEGFAKTSLIPRAKDLKGKLLICQGAIDNVVVWQHSLNFISSCISAKVQVDYFPYPLAEHNVRGRDRVHLMQKVTDYFNDYLK